mmetsp:Transcript_3029/g.2621  ORF Transcript_3029/g.2621 Transcript_3029/m.2621 type:complete len:94 (-) Transcript_3029:339-620(-)
MLEVENIEPRKLAYDRPSHKFLSFLKKHYGLSNYIPQNNNFVVFSQYFDSNASTSTNTTTSTNNKGQSNEKPPMYTGLPIGQGPRISQWQDRI